jgi:hypothetical protein
VNPEYPTYERDAEEANIVGRVIWAASFDLFDPGLDVCQPHAESRLCG